MPGKRGLTAEDVLNLLLTVDGAGSLLDTDFVRGVGLTLTATQTKIGLNAGGANTNTITAIGAEALGSSTSSESLAIGFQAGQNATGNNLLLYGNNAGANSTGNYLLAFGEDAGLNAGNTNVCIGKQAGTNVGGDNIFIGDLAGANTPTAVNNGIALGGNAAQFASGIRVIAFGSNSCLNASGNDLIAIGLNSCENVTGNSNTGIGRNALQSSTGANNIAIGNSAGLNVNTTNVCIGRNAGTYAFNDCIFIGDRAGYNTSQVSPVSNVYAIGGNACENVSGVNFIAYGNNSLKDCTAAASVIGIGTNSGRSCSGSYSINIGTSSGRYSTGESSINIGGSSGLNSTGTSSINIGGSSGLNSTGTSSINIGESSGLNSTGTSSICIGKLSGLTIGDRSIIIGSECCPTQTDSNFFAIGNSSTFNFIEGTAINDPLNATFVLNSTLDSLNSGSGSLVVQGGASFAKTIRAGEDIYLNSEKKIIIGSNNTIDFYKSTTINEDAYIKNNGDPVTNPSDLFIQNTAGGVAIEIADENNPGQTVRSMEFYPSGTSLSYNGQTRLFVYGSGINVTGIITSTGGVFDNSGFIIFENLPTDPAGLNAGRVWKDSANGNVLKVV